MSLITASEWVMRGYLVEGNTAKGYAGKNYVELDITKEMICKDTDLSLKCSLKCLESGGKRGDPFRIKINKDTIECSCG